MTVIEAVRKASGKQERILIEIGRTMYFPFERELSQKLSRSYNLPVVFTVKYKTFIITGGPMLFSTGVPQPS